MRYLLILSILMFPVFAGAEIYQWQDNNGVTHFSDTPQKNSTIAKLPADQSYRVATTISKEKATNNIYQKLQIMSSVANEKGDVTVKVKSAPSLQKSNKIKLSLDEKVVYEGEDASIFLNNIDRGEHVLQAQIVDVDDNVLISSDKITFNMQRPKIHSKK